MRKFFRENSRYGKFDGIEMLLPKHKVAEKLTETEENYLRKGPEFTLENLDGIEPLAVFDMALTVLKIREVIRNLNKVDSFYKRYVLRWPLPLRPYFT